jgi:hypothetical protein
MYNLILDWLGYYDARWIETRASDIFRDIKVLLGAAHSLIRDLEMHVACLPGTSPKPIYLLSP